MHVGKQNMISSEASERTIPTVICTSFQAMPCEFGSGHIQIRSHFTYGRGEIMGGRTILFIHKGMGGGGHVIAPLISL